MGSSEVIATTSIHNAKMIIDLIANETQDLIWKQPAAAINKTHPTSNCLVCGGKGEEEKVTCRTPKADLHKGDDGDFNEPLHSGVLCITLHIFFTTL